MPVLDPTLHPDKETDKCYTPLEHRRRAEMHLRSTRYGFFNVPDGPVEKPKCSSCGHAAEKFVIICGVRQCEPCFNARR